MTNEVLAAMGPKVVLMAAEEKHCAILLDEMAITPKLDFDPQRQLNSRKTNAAFLD
jgi:hypothetical protein